MAGKGTRTQTTPARLAPYQCFPDIYADELFYSIQARFALQLGDLGIRRTTEELFGFQVQKPPIALPFGLGIVANRMPSKYGMTGRDLVRRHTLLPYYMAYRPQAVRAQAERQALSATGRVALTAGVRAEPLGALEALRFCPECFATDRAEGRELYWRRQHQLPIVLVCAEHERLLLNSLATPTTGFNAKFAPASDRNCPKGAKPVVGQTSTITRGTLLEIARDAAMLLGGRYPAHAPETLKDKGFHELLTDKGLTANTQIDWPPFQAAMRLALDPILPSFPAVAAGIGRVSGWLEHATDRSRPHHTDATLLAAFGIARIPDTEPPFGRGPWPCLNPLAEHHGRHTIAEIAPRRAHDVAWRAWFHCECGFSYTRAERHDGSLTSPSLVKFGPTLRPFIETASIEGWSLSRTTGMLGLSKEMLRKAMKAEGINDTFGAKM